MGQRANAAVCADLNKEGPGGDGPGEQLRLTGRRARPGDTRRTWAWAATGERLVPAFRRAPAIQRNMERFDVSQVQMPQPASAIEPGKGQVPVNPFMPSGATARVAGYVADERAAK